MRGIAKVKMEKGVVLDDFPKPVPLANEALIRVSVTGICGSDLGLYDPRPGWKLPVPFILGHEFCGEVEAVGPKVTKLQKGDRVAGDPHIPCMTCYTCETGDAHICPNMRNVGYSVNGSFAEYLIVPEVSLWKVPETLSDHEAAMLEPLGVAVHAVRRSDVVGETVFVMGCGAIGLMTIAAAKEYGASRVFATDIVPERLERGLKMGADQVFQAEDNDLVEKIRAQAGRRGVATAIDMSGSVEAVRQGFEVLRPGGTMVLAGSLKKNLEFDAGTYIVLREINLVGMFGREMWETWYLSEQLMQDGKIDTNLVMGPTYGVEEYEKAFSDAFSGEFGKIFFTFPS